MNIEELKRRLSGPSLPRLLRERGKTKYAVERDLGITVQTLVNWQKRRSVPSRSRALKVGEYLGLVGERERALLDAHDRKAAAEADIRRLGGKPVQP